jgi:hypothetical protein
MPIEGVDVNSKDFRGQTPLILAAKVAQDKVVKLLLADERVDIAWRDDSSLTALEYATDAISLAQQGSPSPSYRSIARMLKEAERQRSEGQLSKSRGPGLVGRLKDMLIGKSSVRAAR